jgi:SAM-dependent methyltransferase
MSSAPPELSAELKARTLARFVEHRRAWDRNPALRACYARWYAMLRAALPAPALGAAVELGAGPGFAAEFIPDLVLTDVVQAPWHARRVSAEALPYGDGELGALLLFDVLHHVAAPARFFAEATRVLRPGGRLLLFEPYISPLSWLIYHFFHPELVDMAVDPLATADLPAPGERDPFISNQAIPTLLFCRQGARPFAARFPQLAIKRRERLAGFAYPASGGLSYRPLLPMPLWRGLFALENRLPELVFHLFGFRLFVVIERRDG